MPVVSQSEAGEGGETGRPGAGPVRGAARGPSDVEPLPSGANLVGFKFLSHLDASTTKDGCPPGSGIPPGACRTDDIGHLHWGCEDPDNAQIPHKVLASDPPLSPRLFLNRPCCFPGCYCPSNSSSGSASPHGASNVAVVTCMLMAVIASVADANEEVMNGEYYQESNGPSALSQLHRVRSEPESIRKWREEQMERLEILDANSRKQEMEWKEKAIKELEEWYARQNEQLQKTKVNNRAAEEAFVNDMEETSPGTEWERLARLCDFNPKSSKQAKDVSRMRSVLISLKQTPLAR
uniref:Clathrin light chain n=2 Tax=Ornithorhynchus anatinus TaxID=9258 RepID=A0A6I8PJ56_ORNAN